MATATSDPLSGEEGAHCALYYSAAAEYIQLVYMLLCIAQTHAAVWF